MTTHEDIIRDLGDTKVDEYWSRRKDAVIFEQIGEAELEFESWQFHLVGVWRHIESGLLFYGYDSGCSCPSPWEATKLSHLQPLRSYQDWLDVQSELLGPTPEELKAQREQGELVFDYKIRDAETTRPRRVDELERLRVQVEQAFKDLKRKQVLAQIVEDHRDALDQLD